ncbi:MAG: hypothetical protein CMO44_15865 [Verrucomicrobiales bacterium]|nr:hypothetical protein [Verrucomicrobiales bacterium]|tara:strand:+ start:2757 stop:3572 length:816 start_codon:yes stop_codon:yes gene_type:complete
MPFLGKAPGVSTVTVSDDAITTAKIADNAITSAKIGVDVIVAEDLAANSVTVSEITDDAVTQAKIADEAVDEARLQISNAGSNGQFLSKQSGNTGGLTWADAGQWSATTEGLVTTTQGQNNIDFTIPADVNQIKVVFYGLSQVSTELFKIKVGNASGTIKGSGYYGNTSSYWYNGNAPSLTENNDAIQLNGWTPAGNYWYGSLNMESIGMDGRRWSYFMAPYNDTYGEYFTVCNGRIALDSGEQIRKIRFTTDSGNGYDSGCHIKVYTAKF